MSGPINPELARRAAAARKGAESRKRRKAALERIELTRAEIDDLRGTEADRAMSGNAITLLIARIRAREA